MKVGDLVKFRSHRDGPHGIVLKIIELPDSPHLSHALTTDRDAAYIEWACEYTAAGNYQLSILETVNENR